MSLVSDLLNAGGQFAAAYLPYEASQSQIDAIQNLVNTSIPQMQELSQQLTDFGEFVPFSVTTGTGTTNIGAGGALTQELGAVPQGIQEGLLGQALTQQAGLGATAPNLSGLQQQAFGQSAGALGGATSQNIPLLAQQNALQGLFGGQLGTFGLPQATLQGLTGQALSGAQQGLAAQTPDVTGAYSGISAPSVSQAASDVANQYLTAGQQALGAATPTAASLYQDIRAMQTPEEERQRLALENRLAAQGRLGVSTAAYGGTPEQLALAKAQQEAQNTAAFQATQMADQLATAAQNRAQQLTAMGLNAEQVQAQLNAEGFGQAMQLASAGISAQQAQQGLESGQQSMATQLAQLGLTGTQAGQQLTTQQLANLTGLQQASLAGATGQQALQQGALNIGTGLFGIGSQAAQLPQQMTATDIANLQGMLGAAYIPQAQQIASLTPAIQASNIAQAAQQGQLEAQTQMGMAGLETQAAGTTALSAVEAARIKALAEALSGMFAGAGAFGASAGSANTAINSLVDWIMQPSGTTASSSVNPLEFLP